MKTNVLFMIVLAGGLTLTTAAFPQSDGKMADKRVAQADNIPNRARNEALLAKDKLALDNEQFGKWFQAAYKRRNANEPLFEQLKTTTDPAQKKALHQQIRQNRKTFDDEVTAFLNDTQKQQWNAWKEEKKKQLKEKHKAKKAQSSESHSELEDVELSE